MVVLSANEVLIAISMGLQLGQVGVIVVFNIASQYLEATR
jgi:hypothetical protein